METLATFLDSLVVTGRLFCRIEGRDPWGLSAGPTPYATFHVTLEGEARLEVAGVDDVVRLAAGQLAILPSGSVHRLRGSVDAPTPPFSAVVGAIDARGELSLGTGPMSSCVMLCGSFHLDDRDAPPLFSLLPPLLVTPPDDGILATAGAAAAEQRSRRSGWHNLTNSLLAVLFGQGLRAWATTDPDAGRSLAALTDTRLSTVLAAVHERPALPWTVDRMAGVAGMSRSSFADLFQRRLGAPPVSYVRVVRMQRAARLLERTDRTLAQVAGDVGYEAEESFSRSFRRHFGVTPRGWRLGETVMKSGPATDEETPD